MEGCLLIQWKKTHTVNGVPCCPKCGGEAEMILGFFGNPCWGHKLEDENNQTLNLQK